MDRSATTSTLEELAAYHNDVADALASYFQGLSAERNDRFLSFSKRDLQLLLQSRREETELRSSLAMLAAVDAALQADFEMRIVFRKEDAFSTACRLKKRPNVRARLNDILTLWAEHHSNLKAIVSEFKNALQFRHWLAHGRYGDRPGHGRFDYLSLYILCDSILGSLPLLSTGSGKF